MAKIKRKTRRKIKRKILIGGIILIFSVITIRGFIEKHNINNDKSNITKEKSSFNNKSVDSTNYKNTKNIILVNKGFGLERGYEPEDLERVEVTTNKEILLRREANENLKRMFQDALKEEIYLLAVSGYRSYEYQEDVYNIEVYTNGTEYANEYVAKPGYSEHQTGLAVDILAVNYTDMDENFENTEECRWLHNNMHKYGFILRYPKGKENVTGYNYEPWHIRYVGTDHSYKIKEEGLTLEEYLDY